LSRPTPSVENVMRLPAAVFLVAALWFVLPERPTPVTAQQPPQAAKWEYAELTFRTTPERPAGKDNDGNEVPGVPAATTVRCTTGADDLSAKGWDEPAENIKAPFRKDSSPASQHM